MARQPRIAQTGIGAALAGRPGKIFDWTDQDQLGYRTEPLDGRDRPTNPDAHWLHVGNDQFRQEPSGLLPEALETAQGAYHFKL